MDMNDTQKAICRELLRLSYEDGFGHSYPLEPIALELGVPSSLHLYDLDSNTGVLWPLGAFGNGLLDVSDDGAYASVAIETKDVLEAWSR